MVLSYKVRFWEIRERADRAKAFEVRWTVNGREKSESFLAKGLAESRKAKLITAARDGEPFDPKGDYRRRSCARCASGPRGMRWPGSTWTRWERTPGNTRRTLAEALATITVAFVDKEAVYHDSRVLRRAVYSWAFNKKAWVNEPREEWRAALEWLEHRSLPVAELDDPVVLRRGWMRCAGSSTAPSRRPRRPSAREPLSTRSLLMRWSEAISPTTRSSA
ncbi:hypothetical protein AB0D38_18230 [Streptomyces sp. NPDC048279]|jgi:hypothetical protein|uniref:hypothetical protein n=1 Tax=Streptomyces sp. NPDC048279 TaxID=3154714 RepID=UPI00344102E6